MKIDYGNGIIYCDRAESGLDKPHNNDGFTPRPLLGPFLSLLTAHYPGSPVGTSFQFMDGNVKKITYISAVQRNAMSNPIVSKRKSFEYNFFIFMDGEIWEYAGDYLAAHSAGENADAYGVQFVNGQDDLCTNAQIVSYRWLRDVHLKGRNKLSVNAATIPHREMPEAGTLCPGDRAIIPRLPELRQLHNPTDPIQPVEDEMQYLIQDTTGVYVTGDFVSYRAVSPSDIDFFMIHGLVQRNADGSARVLVITDHRDRMIDQSPAAVGNRMAWIVNSVLAGIPSMGSGITPAQIQQIISGVVVKLPKGGNFVIN